MIGISLMVSHNDLESINQSSINDIEKLSAVIDKWKDLQSSPFTWETVISCIEGPSVNNERKAIEIIQYLSKGNYYLILNIQTNDTVIVYSNALVCIHNDRLSKISGK